MTKRTDCCVCGAPLTGDSRFCGRCGDPVYRPKRFLQLLAIVLAASAAYVSYNLFLKHVQGSVTPGWFDAGCSPSAESKFNCKQALESPYAYWPPKLPDNPPEMRYIPVAFLGMVHFLVLAVWLMGVGAPSRSRRWLHFIPLILVTLGVIGTGRFLIIIFTMLDQWCPWCLLTHVLNLGLAVVVFLLWPRAPKVVGAVSRRAQSPGDAVGNAIPGNDALRIPGTRQLWITIVACVLVFAASNQLLGKANVSQEFSVLQHECTAAKKEIAAIRADAGKLYNNWRLGDAKGVTVRPDDPARHGGDGTPTAMELVVFSDFQCPSCTKFAGFLEKTIEPMFDRHLRVVFKHLPFDTQCNPYLDVSMHEHACFASKLAEAARLTAGNPGFWRVHDFFFEHRDDLERGKLTVEQVASATQLDAAILKERMNDPAILERIHADIELAKSLEVDGTPAVFVDGKRVERLAAPEIGFWNRLADHYYEAADLPRPPHTIPQRKVVVPKGGGVPGGKGATPGSPSPRGGP